MTTLTTGERGFLRKGEEHLIISGGMHYFRVHPGLWQDRLRRLVALGCNTVETYVAWNFHAPDPDRILFSGAADLGHFLDLAQQEGLDAIVRPGPYICAEWEGGGFPGWLLADSDARLRSLDPAHIQAVDRWFDQLIPLIADHQASRGGNVVAVQVENEYGSYGDDRDYLRHLRDGLIARGIEELLVSSDGAGPAWLSGGTIDGALATVNFGSRTAEVLEMLSRELPDQPQMCMEFWNGWFDHWGEPHHTRDAESAAAELSEMLSNRMSVNLYMAHGGTNFGLWAGANHDGTQHQPTVTSYDYDAPIAENGALTQKFHAYREIIGRYRSLPALDEQLTDLQLPADPPTLSARSLSWDSLIRFPDLPLWKQSGHRYASPPSFEKLGLERGMILLRREIEIDWEDNGQQPLRFHGLADRADVYLDGHFAGSATRNDSNPQVHFAHLRERLSGAGERHRAKLEILVENQGRINFGPLLGERKGILSGVWHHTRFLNQWQVTALPLEDLADTLACQALASEQPDGHRDVTPPLLGVATLRTEESADTFIDTSRAGRGIVWFDDFCLGRYRSEGPQQTLYVPAPLVGLGTHRITVLELEKPDPEISLTDRARLGGEDTHE